jgi:hypothetical protein
VALTSKRMTKLLRRGEPGRYRDGGDVRGLYLVIGSKASAHWELRYQLHGRGRWMGLGSARTFTLAEARARAQQARQKLADKIDPLDTRHAERAAQRLAAAKTLTFAEAAQAYYEQHEAKWRNRKHRAQFLSTLQTYVFPKIGTLPVAAIDTPLVLKCIEPISSPLSASMTS